MEGSSPRYLMMLIAHMKPPAPLPQDEVSPEGFFELTVSGLSEQPEITYFVQLPPEYDPYRRYPCVITLNGAGQVEIRANATVEVTAAALNVHAPVANFDGMINCTTLIASTGVVSPSYTPGVGNVW